MCWWVSSKSSDSFTHTHSNHIISCLCGIVLVYFQGLVKGPLPPSPDLPPTPHLGNTLLVSPRGLKTKRFGTTDLKSVLGAKFQRDGELQGPQRRRELRRPAGPEAVGGPQQDRKLCSCLRDASAPGSSEGTEESASLCFSFWLPFGGLLLLPPSQTPRLQEDSERHLCCRNSLPPVAA